MHAVHLVRLAGAMLSLPLAAHAIAEEAAADDAGQVLPAVTVSALAFDEDSSRIAIPYNIIDRDRLLKRGDGTLGAALEAQAGVHVDTFGAGASRPLIRGQGAPRTRMLSDGAAVLDASDISPDHAVTVDPLLARRIEVLRGPSALLYGGAAIGGVVNVLDHKIPSTIPGPGGEGSVATRFGSGADQRAAAAEMTAAIGERVAIHAEGSYRRAADYRVPDWSHRRVPDSDARSENAALGLSWITDRGYIGAAISTREDAYGLPGHTHEYEDCHAHGSVIDCDAHGHGEEHHGHGDGHSEAARVALRSRRVDLRGQYDAPLAGVERVRFRASHTNYRHHELDHGQIATTFRNHGHDARVEVEHAPLGPLTGVAGVQHARSTAAVEGVEAFMPTVQTRSDALFAVEHLELDGHWHLEFGARHERQRHAPRSGAASHSGSATSWSSAIIREFQPSLSLTMSLARSQRLPHAQELYAHGLHLATNTHECGLLPDHMTCGGAHNDRPIDKETARNMELTLRKSGGALTFAASLFVNSIDNYIWARTLDRHEDFRLIKYSQDDARFHGGELEIGFAVNDFVSIDVFADRVRARLRHGEDLPRIPAGRTGARLHAGWQSWDGELELYRVHGQQRIDGFESPTPGYTMLNASLGYQLPTLLDASLFLSAENLLNRQAWNHASFLAHTIPLPGRNVSLGLRVDF